jgi:thiol-disulfide isomerase/thioredoxin
MQIFFAALIILILATGPALARPSSQPVPRVAPEWDVAEWFNSKRFNLADLKGRVVVVEFFQLWCPGCNAFSIPLMKEWHQTFGDELATNKIKFVSIHTVFEGFDYQTPDRLRRFLKRKKIHHPVGVDRAIQGRRLPQTMRRYGTMGTPEMAIIDKKGVIRFQEFGGFRPASAEALIRKLLAE